VQVCTLTVINYQYWTGTTLPQTHADSTTPFMCDVEVTYSLILRLLL